MAKGQTPVKKPVIKEGLELQAVEGSGTLVGETVLYHPHKDGTLEEGISAELGTPLAALIIAEQEDGYTALVHFPHSDIRLEGLKLYAEPVMYGLSLRTPAAFPVAETETVST